MTLAETSLKIAEIGLPIAFLIAFGTLLIFLIIAFYVYTSLAWYAIAKKLRYNYHTGFG